LPASGFDADLPDDADDVIPGTVEPITSPRVRADERVVEVKRRWGFFSKKRSRVRRHPDES